MMGKNLRFSRKTLQHEQGKIQENIFTSRRSEGPLLLDGFSKKFKNA